MKNLYLIENKLSQQTKSVDFQFFYVHWGTHAYATDVL